MAFRSKILLAIACAALGLQLGAAQAKAPRNLILFVPDGLRALMVTQAGNNFSIRHAAAQALFSTLHHP